MPGLSVVSGAVAAGLVAAGAAATAQATWRHARVVEEVRRRLADTTYQRLGDIGTVEALGVLPLVDRRVQRPGLRGEPGVSYLVRAGRERLLFDTGLNLFGRSRSALVDNAEALGVTWPSCPRWCCPTSMKTTSAASVPSGPAPSPSPPNRSNHQAWSPTPPCR
jgi:hypothetical protein